MALPDRFDPTSESKLYERWLDASCFHADATRSTRVGGDREPFTIVMPPPNVTAILHLGHALDDVTQDVLIRWARMKRQEALWVPGTDHAGIATQNVVEKLIAKEGKTRFDLGREAFVQRTEEFVAETGGTILRQLRAIGASADWSRTAYTLSPRTVARRARGVRPPPREGADLPRPPRHPLVPAVPDVAVRRRSRVQRGDWVALSDPRIRSRLAQLLTSERSLIVATTRPETMLGDVAVAVNPKDERYKDLVGKTVMPAHRRTSRSRSSPTTTPIRSSAPAS